MEQISFEQCFKGAWRDAWRSLMNRPGSVLLLIVYLLSCLVQVQMQLDAATAGPAGTPALWQATVNMVCSLVRLAAWVALPVQAARYVLLDPVRARASKFLDRGFWRYLGVCLAVFVLAGVMAATSGWLVSALIRALGVRFERAYTVMLVAGLFVVCLTYLSTRLCLLLAHVAAGGRVRWRQAWRDSRGRFWSLWGSHVMAALPLSLPVTICFAVLRRVLRGAGGNASAWFFGIASPLAFTVLLLVSVSCSAWLYRRYAMELRETLSQERIEPS